MLELYIELVKSGRRKIEQVPAKFRDAVKKALKEKG